MKLSIKQQRFCEEYTIDFNGTQAAIRAGYSKKTANEQASRLLANVNIQNFIKSLQEETSNRLNITKEMLIEEYAKIAFFDIREVFNVDGGLIDIKQLDSKSAGAIASIESLEEWGKDDAGDSIIIGTTKKVKVFDKIRALQDLGKHLGLFEKDNDQKKFQTQVTIFQLPDNGRDK